jgi:16S rRNA G966 N2-methylase RsmD
MIAPPQYAGLIDKTLQSLTSYRSLADDGIIVCQHDTSEKLQLPAGACQIGRQRKYGNTTFTILRMPSG